MHYRKVYKCDSCGQQITAYEGEDAQGTPCACGGSFGYVGEEYDMEWVEEKKYQQERRRLDDKYNRGRR